MTELSRIPLLPAPEHIPYETLAPFALRLIKNHYIPKSRIILSPHTELAIELPFVPYGLPRMKQLLELHLRKPYIGIPSPETHEALDIYWSGKQHVKSKLRIQRDAAALSIRQIAYDTSSSPPVIWNNPDTPVLYGRKEKMILHKTIGEQSDLEKAIEDIFRRMKLIGAREHANPQITDIVWKQTGTVYCLSEEFQDVPIHPPLPELPSGQHTAEFLNISIQEYSTLHLPPEINSPVLSILPTLYDICSTSTPLDELFNALKNTYGNARLNSGIKIEAETNTAAGRSQGTALMWQLIYPLRLDEYYGSTVIFSSVHN